MTYGHNKNQPGKNAGLELLTIKVFPAKSSILCVLLCVRELHHDRHMVSEAVVSVVVAEVALSLDLNRCRRVVDVDDLVNHLTRLSVLADDVCA